MTVDFVTVVFCASPVRGTRRHDLAAGHAWQRRAGTALLVRLTYPVVAGVVASAITKLETAERIRPHTKDREKKQ